MLVDHFKYCFQMTEDGNYNLKSAYFKYPIKEKCEITDKRKK